MPLKVNDEGMPVSAAVLLLLALVTLALLPNAYEPDVIKLPLLVGGTAFLVGLFLSISLLRRRFAFIPTLVDIPLLLFLLLVVFQTLGAPEGRNARDAALLWGAFGVLFFAGVQLFRADRLRRLFSQSVIITSCLVIALGALELLAPGLLPWSFLPGPGHRAASTLGSASLLAAFLAVTIPVMWGKVLQTRRAVRIALMLAIVAAFGLILASGSRGGLIAALISTALTLFLSSQRRTRALMIFLSLVAVLGAAIVIIPSFNQRFLGIFAGLESASVDRRMIIWDAGWKAVRASIFAGHGTGSIESIIPIYRSPEYWVTGGEDIVRHAHNAVLEIWSDLGLPGLLLWLLIIGLTLRRGFSGLSLLPPERQRVVAPLIAGVCGAVADNIAGISLFTPCVGGYAWLMAGMIWGCRSTEPEKSGGTSPAALPRWLAAIPLPATLAWSAIFIGATFPLLESESHFVTARNLETRGTPEAREEYMRAYQSCTWNPRAAMAVAGISFQEHRPEQSLRALDDVQVRFPLYPRANLLRGMVMASLGRYREANGWIRRELQVCSSPEAEHVHALVSRAIGDTAAERQSLRRLVTVSLKIGRDFFVGESCARLLELGGGGLAEDSVIIAQARKDFGLPGTSQ